MRAALPTLALLSLVRASSTLQAQASIGTIEAASATLSGSMSLSEGDAKVGANAVITARSRTAVLRLSRGGEVLVCSTSALHAARGSSARQPDPLLLALDRGAVEIHMLATASDAILTPDLRFTIARNLAPSALLDLRIRVASNGDTCVENRGKAAPTLEVSEQFGGGLYQVHPNQHLLFEHGSLREVVDGETSPCGCPPPPVLSAANSGISTDVTRAARPGARVADDPDEVKPHNPAEAQHPFPAAESQGLSTSAGAASVPQAPPGQPHAQVAATLAFSADGKNSDGTSPAGAPTVTVTPATPAKASAPPPSMAPTASAAAVSASPSVSAATPAAAKVPAAVATPSTPPPPAPAPAAPLASVSAPANNDKLADHEVAQSPLPPAAPGPRTLAHRVGHFFRHMFGGR